MPDLQDIEKFKRILNAMGGEEAILADRAEEIEDVEPPREGMDRELSELLEAEAPAGDGAPEAAVDFDLADFALPGGEAAAEPGEELDFASLFGEETGAPAPPAGVEELAEPAAGPEPALPEAPEEEEFLLSELLLPEEEAEPAAGPAGFELPPAAEEGEAFAVEPEAEEGEPFDLSALLGEEPPTGEGWEAGEPAAGEEFELPESLDLIAEQEPEPALEGETPEAFEAAAEERGEAVSAEELGRLMEELEIGEPEGPMEPEAFGEFAEPEGPGEAAAFEFPDIEGLEEIAAELPGEEAEEPEEPAAAEGLPAVSEEELAAMEALAGPAEAEEIELGEEPGSLELEAAEEMPAAGPVWAAGEGLEALEGGEGEEYEFDEFSFQSLGEEPGVVEEAAAPPEAVPEEAAPSPEAGVEISLSDKQFERLTQSLGYLPRNLKIIIEELIGERNLGGEDLRKLVDLLVRGAAPSAVAAQVSAVTGKRIVLPRRFEKKTGLAYEEERRRFAYRFRVNILPILRVFVFSLLVLGLFAFLGYRYVYRPLYATTLYRRGYRQIEKERYVLADQDFQRASRLQQFRHWYGRYAEAFIAKKQFVLADRKYADLLARWPGDRKGALGWANLESVYLENFEHADELLSGLLAEDMRDQEALLAQGDNFLRWAEEDENRYEDARFAYASIIDYYGMRDPVLLRMMRYFIRTGKLPEVRDLMAMLEAREKLKVEPELYADVYAELGGFLFDRNLMEELPDPLFKALDAVPDLPEAHYQLARYFEAVGDPREEEKALRAAIGLLEGMPLTRRQRARLIDAYNRLGHLNWRRGEILAAEEAYQHAQGMIEEAQARGVFGPSPEFGAVYKNLGDIYYYKDRNLDTAALLYRKAEANLYRGEDMDYKLGYIGYAAGDFDEALLRFARVVDSRPRNENALLSLANSLYQRSDYFSAQGYFLLLLDQLETRKNSIPFLRIQDNPEHRALMEYLLKVHNNLGVTLEKLAERSGDPEKSAQALVNLTFSSEYFDQISRDPETLARGLTRNLAYLNQRGILYPQNGFALQIYNRLPVDLESRRF